MVAITASPFRYLLKPDVQVQPFRRCFISASVIYTHRAPLPAAYLQSGLIEKIDTRRRFARRRGLRTRSAEGHLNALPYKSSTIDYDKLTICFRKDVATGQYARSATIAPSRQSTESGTADFTPLQPNSDVGLTDQLGGVRIQSTSIEASSRRANPHKRNSELLEIIHCIERSSEGLTTTIRDVADIIRLPKRQHSIQILVELFGIPALSGLDVELAHEWLTVHQDMATTFITADNKEEWILRQIHMIRDSLRF
ncbi:hypothetical protein MRB53_023097 [Persea americana]|uniref:Uncharacterized protein n=1 Tax=Persea americana TaxID=3435 RepID=A0ACC2L9Q6_PERAE|nr:hypothetical protein MRB53_023097 [Persea americana]